MRDLSGYLQPSEATHETAVALLRSLRESGIHIDVRAVPKFVAFGLDDRHDPAIHRMVENVMVPDFDHADELLVKLNEAGYHVDCSALVRDPFIYGKHVHHGRTLEEFRARHSQKATPSQAEAVAYLDYLADHQINLTVSGRIARLLPTQYHPLLSNPDFVLNVARQTKNALARCLPGWSPLHTDRPRFILAENMVYEDFRGVLDAKARDSGIELTDTLCRDCHAAYSYKK